MSGRNGNIEGVGDLVTPFECGTHDIPPDLARGSVLPQEGTLVIDGLSLNRSLAIQRAIDFLVLGSKVLRSYIGYLKEVCVPEAQQVGILGRSDRPNKQKVPSTSGLSTIK